MDDDDERHLNFGEEEEEVGMMTGNRTNRSGIGNHGHDPVEAKLPDHGGSLFNSFLNMANSIIGAGKKKKKETHQLILLFMQKLVFKRGVSRQFLG